MLYFDLIWLSQNTRIHSVGQSVCGSISEAGEGMGGDGVGYGGGGRRGRGRGSGLVKACPRYLFEPFKVDMCSVAGLCRRLPLSLVGCAVLMTAVGCWYKVRVFSFCFCCHVCTVFSPKPKPEALCGLCQIKPVALWKPVLAKHLVTL